MKLQGAGEPYHTPRQAADGHMDLYKCALYTLYRSLSFLGRPKSSPCHMSLTCRQHLIPFLIFAHLQ